MIKEILVPDIGTAQDVDVIEILVKPGDKISVEQPLITLESEKASMEVPSPLAGILKDIKLKAGDKVSKGSLIGTIDTEEKSKTTEQKPQAASTESVSEKITQPILQQKTAPEHTTASLAAQPVVISSSKDIHAGPGVRRLAHEFGVDLSLVQASGAKNRIVKEDVQRYVKNELAQNKAGTFALAKAPVIDFSKFGAIEIKPLNRIKKLTGVNVHRSWMSVPHVTQFGDADITELEAFRENQKISAEKQGVKLTPLVFIMKAVVAVLKTFPQFNASLDASGDNLIYKKYIHLGVAVDTPNGLVVPVILDVDQKGLMDLARELAVVSKKAREKGLSLNEMQGSCFTISSLGGIGGTAFTPIINTPDVAILGVSKASMKPVYHDGVFIPRLLLPLSLSYDHRVIDGADGARFMVALAERLSDIRTLLL